MGTSDDASTLVHRDAPLRASAVALAASRVAILLIGILALVIVVPAIALPWLNIGTTGMGAKIAPHPVLHPAPGLPAARAGIQSGDRLIGIEPDHAIFHPGTLLHVTVEREADCAPSGCASVKLCRLQ